MRYIVALIVVMVLGAYARVVVETQQIKATSSQEVSGKIRSISSLCAENKECDKLAKVLVFEARGEPDKGKAAVAHVVLNRLNDKRWPDTLRGVIYQPKQFSFIQDMHKQTPPTEQDWNIARAVAYKVMNKTLDDPTNGGLYYHATHVSPRWAKKVQRVERIGNHIFYK